VSTQRLIIGLRAGDYSSNALYTHDITAHSLGRRLPIPRASCHTQRKFEKLFAIKSACWASGRLPRLGCSKAGRQSE